MFRVDGSWRTLRTGCFRMAKRFGSVLIVGGTGMLSDVTRWVAKQSSRRPTLVSRHPEELAEEVGARPWPLDLTHPDARDNLPQGPFDESIVWLHDTMISMARPLADLLSIGGRQLRIHGAMSADPVVASRRDPAPRTDIATQIVILGWHPDPDKVGGKRWLTSSEICKGVISALEDPDMDKLLVGTKAGR